MARKKYFGKIHQKDLKAFNEREAFLKNWLEEEREKRVAEGVDFKKAAEFPQGQLLPFDCVNP